MSIAQNLENIHKEVASIATNCGRQPEEIQIVAVSKRFPSEAIEQAYKAGQMLFGENYIQEAEKKIAELDNKPLFHFIGHLQRNKAKTAARLFDCIETVDSFKLAKSLNGHLEREGRVLKILLQVNIGKDPKKAGTTEQETEKLLQEIKQLPHLRAVGLMTMPPLTDAPEEARPYFRNLRMLSERLTSKGLFDSDHKVELSMGMSGDYPIAIEEGATIIRIGTAIFGTRSY
ncbi:YggS family pyridoxal phosphate-dependent enzyme [Desulfopila sp. IMCC35008]|uniref:YggS family pyridoxal phosphate-dependent enzyme n=1 Tax=Desulfopila sp. IMCC35008 TaxID=2653858 RepID=UPI0013D2DE09|nr:YggS family pyridoxal phosphate-dependent enzyme [Desulfopila sp. IMCC35008]